jgi:hypothetical protein
MEPISFLYVLPTWVTFGVTVLVGLAAMEVGLRLGRRRDDPEPEQGPVDTLTGGTVGLLAFLLAFAFGIAAARFDTRSDLVVAEAQATRGAYLYASLLPSPQREKSHALLREYVAIRIEGVKNLEKRKAAIERSEAIHRQLWDNVRGMAAADPEPAGLSSYTDAVTALIASHQERKAKAPGRLPPFVWWSLYLLAVAALTSLGYQLGLARSRRPVVALFGVMALAVVVTMIMDLDRGQQGFLTVSQRALEDVLSAMGTDAS